MPPCLTPVQVPPSTQASPPPSPNTQVPLCPSMVHPSSTQVKASL